MAATETNAPYVGRPIPRVEDARLLRGLGLFVDDIQRPGMLHAAFARSPHGHARITRIDASPARELDGVALVLTAEDIEDLAPIATGLPREEVVANNRPVLPSRDGSLRRRAGRLRDRVVALRGRGRGAAGRRRLRAAAGHRRRGAVARGGHAVAP